ncbi:hypothetical protein G7Y89_g6721 [Cudoniella acicularis]|uniref:Flavin-containing monooxygenase n=1 Tax=Cudoniella acicularis TaxID=354080 RepID=A0A8H4W585_9HELO|nr:hypothetical protein G7Y89_g6721 [Cudoniella acicularis]
MEKQTIAVIGAGPSGLAILKNLREEGFLNVTMFEKRDSIGGVWAYSADALVTSTIPYFPPHPDATQVLDYIKSYAKHFDLERDVKLNTPVKWVKRNAENTAWKVCIESEKNEEIRDFDKVVFCHGLTYKAVTPEFEGMEKFKGKMIHCQAFKSPAPFKDMRVLVVGIGNSAADTSTELIDTAKKIYLSHRGGGQDSSPKIERVATRPRDQRTKEQVDPSWRLKPAPSLANHQPVISDNLVSSLAAGSITSVPGLRRFVDGETVELTDGTALTVDAVIFCTGYEPDFSLNQDFSPLTSAAPKSPDLNSNDVPRARLYQNLFPPEFADSLVYMNYFALTDGVIPISDLAAMVIAQVWKGSFKLPSEQAMNAEIDEHHAWVKDLAKDDSVYTGIIRPGPWFAFLNEAAGTGLNENLGYGLQGWKFWLKDMKLCNLMMRGVRTPFMHRMFDGRRKKWNGAREAILHANELAKEYK